MMVTFLNRIFINSSVFSKVRIRQTANISNQTLRDPNRLFVSSVACDNVSLSEIHNIIVVPISGIEPLNKTVWD
jgi:hypothetical protein